jgi:hypothetical protein
LQAKVSIPNENEAMKGFIFTFQVANSGISILKNKIQDGNDGGAITGITILIK